MTALDMDRGVSVDMPALQQLARAREMLNRARGHAVREAAQSAVRKAVEDARDAGCGWGQIGDVLGIARGNAYQKYRRKPLLGALSEGPPARRDARGQDVAQWTQATQDLPSWARQRVAEAHERRRIARKSAAELHRASAAIHRRSADVLEQAAQLGIGDIAEHRRKAARHCAAAVADERAAEEIDAR